MHIWNLCWAWPTVILKIINWGKFYADFYGFQLYFRYTFRFKWSDSLVQDGPPSVIQDAQFEIASVLMETAIWLIKYGARIAGKEDITEADAKIVHKALSLILNSLISLIWYGPYRTGYSFLGSHNLTHNLTHEITDKSHSNKRVGFLNKFVWNRKNCLILQNLPVIWIIILLNVTSFRIVFTHNMYLGLG